MLNLVDHLAEPTMVAKERVEILDEIFGLLGAIYSRVSVIRSEGEFGIANRRSFPCKCAEKDKKWYPAIGPILSYSGPSVLHNMVLPKGQRASLYNESIAKLMSDIDTSYELAEAMTWYALLFRAFIESI